MEINSELLLRIQKLHASLEMYDLNPISSHNLMRKLDPQQNLKDLIDDDDGQGGGGGGGTIKGHRAKNAVRKGMKR